MIKRGALPHNVRKNDLSDAKTTGTFAPAYLKSAIARQDDSVSDVEFGEKKWVWIKDEKSGFLRAWITKEDGDILSVRCSDDSVSTLYGRLSDDLSLRIVLSPAIK